MALTSNDERSNESMMDPLRLLQLLRPSVLVVDAFGTILAAHGGHGSTLGFDNAALVGRNTLEFVEPAQREMVASYFLAEGSGLQRTRFPLPFRTTIVAADGSPVMVDTINALGAAAPRWPLASSTLR
ncbi:MAG: hypothetical protein HC869_24615 [Rhodospirillales bacterium]|nr:hypothetical protein [Rhodospirillales bacterium]